MATRVYKVAVVGCPRSVLSPEGLYDGVGKSCLCNRFIRAEAYSEDHQQDSSEVNDDEWTSNPVFNGDHFIYWGAANKHLPDKTKVRFQVVEHTEFYHAKSATKKSTVSEDEDDSFSEDDEEEDSRSEREDVGSELPFRLNPHLPVIDYVTRTCAIHFRSHRQGKMAYRLKALEEAVRRSSGPVRATTQLFPNEDFGGKKTVGIYGFICVFDPTLDGEQMQRQLNFLSELLRALVKTKRKVVIACVKCDMVEDHKIRFGSKLSTYALKKYIPFFEVSARDSVNVDDLFFSLVPSKIKNPRRNSSYSGYREVIDSRKGDLNRAKDAFRKMLQEQITDFSFKWSEALLFLKADYTYQSVKELLGEEADEVLLKMFQLRLIEIKLKEASKQFGNSLAKKANKVCSHQYQVYLKKAFIAHPDLKCDSTYKEYIPELSESDETDILTDPSTPSSYCQTPDLSDVFPSRFRGSTISVNQDSPRVSLVKRPIDDITSIRGTLSSDDRDYKLSPASSVTGDVPPPLPARDTATLNRRKTVTTMSSCSSINSRNMSISMDQLNLQDKPDADTTSEDAANFDRLDAEPYLQPMEVQRVLGQSVGQSMRLKDNLHRNSPDFRSMRLSHKTLPPSLPINTSPEKSGEIMLNRTHRRSRSNPFVLATVGDFVHSPPHLPPRNFDSVSSMGTPKHRMSNTPSFVESSMDFSSPTMFDTLRRLSKKPLPSIPDDSSLEKSKQHTVTRNRILTSRSVDFDGDGDNLSQISGPFEDIETTEKRVKDGVSLSLPDLIGSSSTLPEGSVPPTSGHGGGGVNIEDDEYAEIDEFQQYMQMSSAPLNVEKSKTLPSSQSQLKLEGQGENVAVALPPTRRSVVKSISSTSMTSHVPVKGARKDTMSLVPSTALISTLKKRLKFPRNEPSIPEEYKDGATSPMPPRHATVTSIPVIGQSPSATHDIRPLPPSPSKAILNRSSNQVVQKTDGSNIYEVIDEGFVSELTNRPSSKNLHREAIVEWEPPVGCSLWPKYLEVTHAFFNLPQVQELWLDTVKSIMTDVDPEDICPPYFNVSVTCAAESLKGMSEVPDEQERTEEEGRPESSSPLDADTKLVKMHSIPPSANTLDNGIIPIHLPPLVPPHRNETPDGASSPAERGLAPQLQLQAPSPSGSSHGNSKLSVDDDHLIMMLNQCQHYDSDDEVSSSNEDSDEDELDSKSSSDSDFSSYLDISLKPRNSHELVITDLITTTRSVPSPPPLTQSQPEQRGNNSKLPPKQTPPKTKVKPNKVPLQMPSLLTSTRELRAMDSNDSDKLSTDSALTKSPISVSVGDFDMDHAMKEDGEGVVHNVKPSQIFKNRTTYRQTTPELSGKIRGDSGTFEEEDSLPRTLSHSRSSS